MNEEAMTVTTKNGHASKEMSKLSFDDLKGHANTLGLPVVVDKEELLGKEFVIVGASIHEGDFGPFVALECKLREGTIVVINDGSTGIYAQVTHAEFPALPLYCARGLRKSVYKNPAGNGNSTTYYLT